ncbi:hypothetical protein M8C21_009501, partial [Ambrosia artemisiifolia]
FTFSLPENAKKFMEDHQRWEGWCKSLVGWEGQQLSFERIVLLRIQGLPIILRCEEHITKIGERYGHVIKDADMGIMEPNLTSVYVGVVVDHGNTIKEELTVNWGGVEGITAWKPDFVGENTIIIGEEEVYDNTVLGADASESNCVTEPAPATYPPALFASGFGEDNQESHRNDDEQSHVLHGEAQTRSKHRKIPSKPRNKILIPNLNYNSIDGEGSNSSSGGRKKKRHNYRRVINDSDGVFLEVPDELKNQEVDNLEDGCETNWIEDNGDEDRPPLVVFPALYHHNGAPSRCSTHSLSVIFYSVLFFSNIADARGFDSLLHQLQDFRDFKKIFYSTVELNVMDYGAKGDGISDDTKVFADVWDMACSSKVKSRIIIPDGSYCLVEPISLGGPCLSKVTLVISGSIVAPSDPDVWDGKDTHKWLYFHNVDHLTVEGGGTIDGMGHEWWATSCKTDPKNAITFHRCNNLVVKNLMIVNGQQMQMAFTTCDGVAVSHLSVFAPASSPNTDGIHISESTNVEVKDTTVRTDRLPKLYADQYLKMFRTLGPGDDCISIVSNSSKVQVRRIVCGPGHGIRGTSATKEAIVFACSDVSPCEGIYLEDVEIVSAFGGVTTSFCWQVKGSTAGYGAIGNHKPKRSALVGTAGPAKAAKTI